MATIASLDIGLGVNSAKLKAGLDEATAKTKKFANSAKAQADKASKAFSAIAVAVGTLAAFAGAGALLQHADALKKNANAAGIGFAAFQKLQFGLEQAGLADNALEDGLKTLNPLMLEAGKGSKGAAEDLALVGLSFEQLSKMKPEERFRAVVAGLDGIKDEGQRSAVAMKLLGEQFAVRKFSLADIDNASKSLYVMSDASAIAAEGFNDSVNVFTTNLGNIVTDAIAPIVSAITVAINALNQFAAENPVMSQIIAGVVLLGTTIAAVAGVIAVAGFPIVAVIGVIAAAIAGIVYATNNWDSVVRSFTEMLASTFNVSVEQAAGWIETLANWISEAVNWVIQAANWLSGPLASALGVATDAIKTTVRIFADLFSAIASLFNLSFAGFASNMMNAFSEVGAFFQRTFGQAVAYISTNIKDQFSWAMKAAGEAFSNAVRAGINAVLSSLETALNKLIGAANSITTLGGIVDGPTIAPVTIKTVGPADSAGPQPSWQSYGSFAPAGMTYGKGSLTGDLMPPSATDTEIADNTAVIADALTGSGGGKGGGGGGGKGKKEKTKEDTDKVSTEFMDSLKSSFSTLLKTGDWKQFTTSMLDKLTTGILDKFSSGLMDALFGNTFDNLFENFGKMVSDGLSSVLGKAAGSAGGGGGGLFGGIFSSIGSFFGFSEGGLVPSTPYSSLGRDSVPAMLTPGEVVVPVDQVGKVMGGSDQVFNINITGNIDKQTERKIYEMLPQIASGVNAQNKEVGHR
jgi:hypothetical protein